MLNDFVVEDGALVVPEAKNIVPNIRRRLEKAREKGWPVIYTTDSHAPDDPEFNLWPPHAVKGTRGAEVIAELAPQKDDHVVVKTRYSAFFKTNLESLLKKLQVDTLILTGVVTNMCVWATALDGYMRGYKIVVPQDSVTGVDSDDHKFALEQMAKILQAEIQE